uniref:Uncharacterized protein n=1 Tax=Lutzomyia longipalpis TaxID=7200 RepID=A0A7G3B4J1_LUTLO
MMSRNSHCESPACLGLRNAYLALSHCLHSTRKYSSVGFLRGLLNNFTLYEHLWGFSYHFHYPIFFFFRFSFTRTSSVDVFLLRIQYVSLHILCSCHTIHLPRYENVM